MVSLSGTIVIIAVAVVAVVVVVVIEHLQSTGYLDDSWHSRPIDAVC